MIITSASEPIIATGWNIRLNTSLSFPNHRVFPVDFIMSGVDLSSNVHAIAASGEKVIHIQSLNILIRFITIRTKSGTQNATSKNIFIKSEIEKFFKLVISSLRIS